jgi:hypothetical protein
MRRIEGEGGYFDPTAQKTKPEQAPAHGGRHSTSVQPEQTQPLQGRAEGRQSLQGPTTVDGHEPDTRQPDPKQQSREGNPSASPVEQKAEGNAAKPSRIPDQKIAFVQRAYAAGADKSLDERLRFFMAHAVAKPHLTLKELAPLAGVGTAERARGLLETGFRTLYDASPTELQQQYPLEFLLRHRSYGVPYSAERKAQWSEAMQRSGGWKRAGEAREGRKLSHETRTRMSEAKRKYWERRRKEKQEAG